MLKLTPIASALQTAMPILRSPTLAERPENIVETFAPLERILDQIEHEGEIETARGTPVFQDDRGWYEIAPAIEGLIDFHEIAMLRTGRRIDTSALRTLASRLNFGIPITPEDITRARVCITLCKAHAASLTVAEANSIVTSVKLRAALEKAA